MALSAELLPNRILLVSDNAQLRVLLGELLTAHRYEVVSFDGAALPTARRSAADCDAAIIDTAATACTARWLRGLDGSRRVPTIAIAAAKSGSVAESLWGRVDAVLHAPFDARRLLFVMRGLFAGRRRTPGSAAAALTAGPVTLHSLLNTVVVEAREIALTGVETGVLRELMLGASTPVSRDRLTRSSLGRGWSPEDRCLDTHIKRLRRKIGNDRCGRTPIRTIRGIGYLLLEEWQPAP
jgi:DNA-binding response OmpR family regulator